MPPTHLYASMLPCTSVCFQGVSAYDVGIRGIYTTTPHIECLYDDMLELSIHTQYYPTDMHYFLKVSWIKWITYFRGRHVGCHTYGASIHPHTFRHISHISRDRHIECLDVITRIIYKKHYKFVHVGKHKYQYVQLNNGMQLKYLQNLVSYYHVDSKYYFWIITWISKYYYMIVYNKQHTLSCKSMNLLPDNSTYQAKHIPEACEHSGKNSCCNLISMERNHLYSLSTENPFLYIEWVLFITILAIFLAQLCYTKHSFVIVLVILFLFLYCFSMCA